MGIDFTTSWAQWGIKGERKAVTRYHAKGEYESAFGNRGFNLSFMTENNAQWLIESQPGTKKPRVQIDETEGVIIQEILRSLPSPMDCPASHFKQEMLEMIRGGESLTNIQVRFHGELRDVGLIEGGKYFRREGVYLLNNETGKLTIESLPPGSTKPSLVSMNVEVSNFVDDFENNGFEILLSALEAALRTVFL